MAIDYAGDLAQRTVVPRSETGVEVVPDSRVVVLHSGPLDGVPTGVAVLTGHGDVVDAFFVCEEFQNLVEDCVCAGLAGSVVLGVHDVAVAVIESHDRVGQRVVVGRTDDDGIQFVNRQVLDPEPVGVAARERGRHAAVSHEVCPGTGAVRVVACALTESLDGHGVDAGNRSFLVASSDDLYEVVPRRSGCEGEMFLAYAGG